MKNLETPSFTEDHISQLPALQLLQQLGYTYLSPEKALHLRGGKTTQVLLEGILRTQLEKINAISYKGQTYAFSDGNLQAGIQALKDLPMQEGYMSACEYVYDLLTMGKALEQSIGGDKKSYTLQYIDWNPATFRTGNVFHVTEEFSVMRSTSKEHYRPDLVLFVNGIPLCVIECKRPDMKTPLSQAISQHLRNQQEDGIRGLYVYAQLLLSLATHQAAYGTNATPEKFWAQWEEKFEASSEEQAYRHALHTLRNTHLTAARKDELFAERFRYVRHYFEAMEKGDLQTTRQDEYLYSLCRPERLLDLTHNYILFEDGEKKIARYQQYFAIRKTMGRVRTPEHGKRRGGVIWHTQGSGKSLTMVMLAQAIAQEKSILNPKIILVTDRVDLDSQLTKTFGKCKKPVLNAATGQRLIELLESKSDAVVTTIINKFEAAVNKATHPFTSPDIFVLIDEGHRTQYGTFNVKMQKVLPNACFLAFTGTPLLHKEKSTAGKFGGIIDKYTVDKAVKDGAVVPILYEGRHAVQEVNTKAIDRYFDMVSEPLTQYQRADLKKKFSRADQLNTTEQKIHNTAWDITTHYLANWGKDRTGTHSGFKGMVVCPNKLTAIRYKEVFDQIGRISTDVIISAPDERDDHEEAYGDSNDAVQRFWKKMMDKHGKKYEENTINQFKHGEAPELLIVVDKLLTGFDAPRAVVLYVCRSLKEHTLLQAIARVNRVSEGKDYGYIIDYYGILGELDQALTTYTSLEDFDEEDLAGTLTDIREELKKLPQRHSELVDIFKTIPNKLDEEAYAALLGDEAIRSQFYDKLSAFARALKIALASLEYENNTPGKEKQLHKDHLLFFSKLRVAVRQLYSDTVDFKAYEKQIQKLLDQYVTTDEIIRLTELVDIMDKDAFEAEVERVVGTSSKAETIASRTARHITERMEEDPVFYKKLSEMIQQTIADYRAKRISDMDFLRKAREYQEMAYKRTTDDTPERLKEKEVAKAFYGVCLEYVSKKLPDEAMGREISVWAALAMDSLVQQLVLDNGKPIIDWSRPKSSIMGKLQILLGDYLIDEVRDKYDLSLPSGEIDIVVEKCIDIAKVRYK